MKKSGRNEPCPCGSGKKYKQCCLSKQGSVALKPILQVQQQLQHALRLAHTHHAQGAHTHASTICHQILSVLPNQPDAWHLLGVIALQQGNIDTAIANFQRAIQARANNPEYLGNLAFAFHEKGDLEMARRLYDQTLTLAPDYGNALYNQHALLLKYPSKAIANLEKLLCLNSADREAFYMLGVLYECMGRPAEAHEYLAVLNNGSALDKARWDAWQNLKSSSNKLPPLTGSMIETFRIALDGATTHGMVLEFGVRFGNTIRQIATLTEQPVFGFDSFEGLPEVWHHEPKGSYSTQGEIPQVPDQITLVAGWFEDTLPKFLETHAGPVRFINIDCDIYSSTKTVLDLLAPRIVSGTVIVFDEYIGNEHWREDEYKAFQEAVTKYGWSYEYLCFSVFTKQVVIRIKSI